MKSRRKTAGCINKSAGFVERVAVWSVSSYCGCKRRHRSTGEQTLTQHQSASIFSPLGFYHSPSSPSLRPPSADSFSFAVTQVLPPFTGDSDRGNQCHFLFWMGDIRHTSCERTVIYRGEIRTDGRMIIHWSYNNHIIHRDIMKVHERVNKDVLT